MTDNARGVFVKPRIDIGRDEILLFSNVRNEAARLPYFFSFYRHLGVGKFFIVDNGSTDDTPAVVRAQPDAHYFHTDESYATSGAGRKWTTELANHYGMGHWCITADADELLIFPGIELLSYRDLTEYLEKCEDDGIFGVLLDMYHTGTLREAKYPSGEPFLSTCPDFDADTYWIQTRLNFPHVQIKGGPRWRLFWAPNGQGEGPAMRKNVLVKWRPGFKYVHSTHSMTPVRLADVTGVVLHFKFFSSFSALAEQEVVRGDRSKMDDYALYATQMSTESDIDFTYSGSSRYQNSITLIRNGFVCAPDAFLRFLRQKARHKRAQERYRTAIERGLALSLPETPEGFLDEMTSAALGARSDSRISLKQFSTLWPMVNPRAIPASPERAILSTIATYWMDASALTPLYDRAVRNSVLQRFGQPIMRAQITLFLKALKAQLALGRSVVGFWRFISPERFVRPLRLLLSRQG